MGDLIGQRYRLEEELGRSRLSVVWKAQDLQGGQPVIVKILQPRLSETGSEATLRFLREVRVLARLSHPHIVELLDVGQKEDCFFLVTRYVPGASLDQWMRQEGPIQVESVLKIAIQITQALDYVHDMGIIHRDIKPSNILVTQENGSPWVKVADFGLAWLQAPPSASFPEQEVVGTLAYISPEQAGVLPRPVDERSDLYSLGILLYELVGGSRPYRSENLSIFLHEQLAKQPPSLRSLRPDLPPVMEEMIFRLLAKGPEDRYPSAASLLADLVELQRRFETREATTSFSIGRVHTARFRAQTRLIGREGQMAELKRGVEALSHQRGGLWFVAGEGGSGKTRLVEEVATDVVLQNGFYLVGRCHQYARQFPYNALVEIVSQLSFRIQSSRSSEFQEAWRQRIVRAAGSHGDLLAKIFPSLKEIFKERTLLGPLDPERERVRLLRALSTLFVELSRQQAMLLFVDDLQWADDGTLGWLQEIHPMLGEVPLMIIASYRKEEVSGQHPLNRWLGEMVRKQMTFHLVEVPPFNGEQTETFCSETLGLPREEVRAFAGEVWEKSLGNPLFIAEILKAYIREGMLRIQAGRWSYQPPLLGKVPQLTGLTDSVMRRAEGLSPQTREILNYASLFGREFTLEKLQFLTGKPDEVILNALDEAVREHILLPSRRSPMGVYNFTHDRVHEAFYANLDPTLRRQRHQEIAERLERETPEDLYAIAHHYSEGRDPAKALYYCQLAGERAKAAYAHDEARYFYQKALENLQRSGREELEIKEKLADIHAWTGEYLQAIQSYQGLLPQLRENRRRALVEAKIAATTFRSGSVQVAVEQYIQALRSFGIRIPTSRWGLRLVIVQETIISLGYALVPLVARWRRIPNTPFVQEMLRAIVYAGYAAYFIRTELSLYYLFTGLNLAMRVGPSPMLAHFLSAFGVAIGSIPWFWLSHRAQRKGLRIWEELNDPWGIAQIKSFMGIVSYYQADRERSIALLKESIDRLVVLGDPWEAPTALYNLAISYIWQGSFREAEEALLKALQISERVGENRAIGMTMSQLAWLRGLQGRDQEADEASRRAIEASGKSGAIAELAVAYGERGRFLLLSGRPEEALPYLEKAMEIFRERSLRADYNGQALNTLTWAYHQLSRQDPSFRRQANRSARAGLLFALAFRNHLAEACRLKALLHWDKGHSRRARWWLERSLAAARRFHCRYEEAIGLRCRGEWFRRPQDLQQAKGLFTEMGAGRVLKEMGKVQEEKPMDEEMTAVLPKVELETLLEASRLISSVLNLDELLEKIMDKIIQLMRAERGFLMLYEEGVLVPKVVRSVAAPSDEEMLQASMSVVHRVEEGRQGLVITDAQLDPHLNLQESVIRGKLRSILAAPLLVRDRLLGVIYVDNRLVPDLYTPQDLRILSALAVQAAISIENAMTFRKIEDQVKFQTQELEAANRQIQAVSELKSQLVSIASHDLKSPLAVVRESLLQIAEEFPNLSDRQRQLIALGEKGAKRMLNLINELLDFSRIETGKIELNRTVVDLTALVRGCLEVVKSEVERKGVRLLGPEGRDPLTVKADGSRIAQVVDNLIRNAIRHTPSGGWVAVTLNAAPQEIVCTVRDKGVGIAPEHLPKLFNQFTKFGNYAGLGLGLFISKKFVEMHGGRIWVESQPGEGTIFHFTLPRS